MSDAVNVPAGEAELTISDFKKRRDKKRTIVKVPLPDFGGHTFVRSMSAGEFNWYQTKLAEFLTAKRDGKLADNKSPGQTALLLSLTVCNSEGRLMFKLDDQTWLTELEKTDLDELERQAGWLNKLPGYENPTTAPTGTSTDSTPTE